MEITDVAIRLVEQEGERLKAVCTMTIDDCFVVRDIKIVEGPYGLFVAMPSRRNRFRCPKCSHKNEFRARFCNACGARTPGSAASHQGDRTEQGRPLDHSDVAHPINSECREMIQRCIIEAYQEVYVEEFGRLYEPPAPMESRGGPLGGRKGPPENDDLSIGRVQIPREDAAFGRNGDAVMADEED